MSESKRFVEGVNCLPAASDHAKSVYYSNRKTSSSTYFPAEKNTAVHATRPAPSLPAEIPTPAIRFFYANIHKNAKKEYKYLIDYLNEKGNTMGRLEGKVAIVTGSTSGIGIGIAKVYAAEGATVVISGRRAEKGQVVVDQIVEAGGKASFHYFDITEPASIEALIADTVEQYGKLDILVNNAANVALKDGRVDELTLEMWDAIMESDLRGTFYATKCAIPYMKEIGGGAIVNIGSMASCAGDLGSTAYACAKAGVDIFTQYVALQYGKDNIRCNCIRPGLIVTPENEAKVPQMLKDIFLGSIMVNRYGCPEDIAHAAVYFGSDESVYTTGQIINVDGGMNSHAPTVAQFRQMNSRTW